jgi:transcriptional regulator with XRE-family HTH domain
MTPEEDLTPEEEESLREARKGMESHDPAADEEEAAEFKGIARAVIGNRERQGMTREEVARKAGLTVGEVERIESAEVGEIWGDLRRIAKGLAVSLDVLLKEAEELAPGPGGEEWRKWTREAESDSASPGARNDAAEGGSERGGRRGR